MPDDAHPIDVDLEKILPILAKEIYDTPFAFLRENVQNAFDAVRIQRYREAQGQEEPSDHSIRIEIDGPVVRIADTGIGMSRDTLRDCYWSVGRSGKHGEEAKAAGVVGTFGIGGMANFGVCSRLEIVTRTSHASGTIACEAKREELSASEKCVFYRDGPTDALRGTTITAQLISPIDPEDAKTYLAQIVSHLDVPVTVNGALISEEEFPTAKGSGKTVEVSSGNVTAEFVVSAEKTGTAELTLTRISVGGESIPSTRGFFSSGTSGTRAFQHGFMLAQVPAGSVFALGGILDCPRLRPTAGRESLTSESQALVQQCLNCADRALAEHIARDESLPDRYSRFFDYVRRNSAWDLAGNATVRLYGAEERMALSKIRDESGDAGCYYCRDSHDRSMLETYRDQGKRIVLLSTDAKRSEVESEYLRHYCNGRAIEDKVTCLRFVADSELEIAQVQFMYSLRNKLRIEYFVESLSVKAGELTHDAALWAPSRTKGADVLLVVDTRHPQIQRLIEARQSLGYTAVFDMFVRDTAFPHLEGAFPELRRRGFDMLMKRLQTTVEYWKLDPEDVERLELLAEVTHSDPEELARAVGASMPGVARPATVSRDEVVAVADVISVEAEGSADSSELRERVLAQLLEEEIGGKILDTVGLPDGCDLGRFYLAMTEDAAMLYRWIIERKPSADFLWGGHRAGFVFYQEGEYILYYDLELRRVISSVDGGKDRRAGRVPVNRECVLCKNKVFIPIPEGFKEYFVPQEAPVHLLIRHQILGSTL